MDDSSWMTWLSVIPILVIIASLGAVLLAWRSGRRRSRIAVGGALFLVGIFGLLGLLGPTFSAGGGLFIGGVGILLLLAALRSGAAAE